MSTFWTLYISMINTLPLPDMLFHMWCLSQSIEHVHHSTASLSTNTHIAGNRMIYNMWSGHSPWPQPTVQPNITSTPLYKQPSLYIYTFHSFVLRGGHHFLYLLGLPHWAVSQWAYLCVIVLSGWRGQFVKGLFLAANSPVAFPKHASK